MLAPQLLIFACTPLENGTSWLMADYRVQCWTPRHKLYAGVGVIWTLMYPIGIPLCIIYALYATKVPWLATWKRNCAWLRALAHRAIVMGHKPPAHFDPETVTTDSISLEHLRMLHRLFVSPERKQTVAALKQEQLGAVLTQRLAALEGSRHRSSMGAPLTVDVTLVDHAPVDYIRANGSTSTAKGHGSVNGFGRGSANSNGHDSAHGGSESLAVPHSATVRQMLHNAAMAAEDDEAPLSPRSGLTSPTSRRTSTRLPRSGSERTLSPAAISRRNSLQNLAALRQSTEHLVRPRHPFVALLYDVQQALVRATQARFKSMRRTMSSILYTSERDQLLSALLDWAKHDKQNEVSEPRNNLTRWRTAHEWKALRAGGAKLGLHDTTERAAFAKFSFVFADYAVHAWWWEVIDVAQKLFLTSVIAFIAPRTSLQCVFPNSADNPLRAHARGFER